MFLNIIKKLLCPGHKICVRNKCCVRGQTGKHLCRQHCVRNNVSSFARAYTITIDPDDDAGVEVGVRFVHAYAFLFENA